jgi:DNA-binding NtrC family response regulator
MNYSKWNTPDFIDGQAVNRLMQALKENGNQELDVSSEIQLEAVFQALEDGASLGEIIKEAVSQIEKHAITHVLASTNGNKAQTARILKIDYKTLYRKMNRYDV